MEMINLKILIAAGGTGGHIIPGIAIANALKEDGNDIIFVGTKYGMEKDLVPNAGYEIKYIHAAGFYGKIIEDFKSLAEIRKGVKECIELIKNENIDLVIGTGGYVTAPLIKAAQILKIPNFIHESNALPGKTTKILSPKTTCTMLGFNDAAKRIVSKNIRITGNPNKMWQNTYTKNEAKEKININGKLLLITGGSQGAKGINDAIINIITNNLFKEYNVIYATGPKNYEEVTKLVLEKASNYYEIEKKEDEIILYSLESSLSIGNKNDKNIDFNTISVCNKIIIKKFIYDMEVVMKAADLMVSRSGALTCTEIIECGTPSIMIPFPYAAENHQYYNAKTLEDAKAGIIIEEKNLNYKDLSKKINELILDDKKINEMSENAKKLIKGNASKKIKEIIYEYMKVENNKLRRNLKSKMR